MTPIISLAPSAQRGNGLFVCPKPFLEKDKAKQNLVIVLPAGCMLLEEFARGTWTKVLIDLRTAVKEGLGHLAVDRAAEPIIHDIDAESALRTF